MNKYNISVNMKISDTETFYLYVRYNIIIIIFIYYNWVVTRWQWLFYM